MTRGPKTVRPDQLASEALEFLNSTKKTQLIVVEDERPVGVVLVHDLLRKRPSGRRSDAPGRA